MSTSTYRLTVLGCALAWFLVGMHARLAHQMTHHGRVPSAGVLALVGLLVVAAVMMLWRLLRRPPASGAAAT
jgi:hypothetical protein